MGRLGGVSLLLVALLGCQLTAHAQRRGRETPPADTLPELTEAQVVALYHDAATRHAQEAYDEAAELYQTFLKYRPNTAAAHYNLARIWLTGRNYTAARTAAETALKLDGTNFWYYEVLSAIAAAELDYAKAARYLEKGLALSPDQLEARFTLADYYTQAADYSKALEQYTQLADLTGERTPIALRRYHIFLRMGNLSAATELLREVIGYENDPQPYYELLYDTYRLAQDARGAQAVLDELLGRYPTNSFGLTRQLEALLRANDLAGAEALLEPLFEAPGTPLALKLALLDPLVQAGPPAQPLLALLFERLASRHPEAAQVQLRVGEEALRRGDMATARAAFLRVVAQDRTQVAAWRGLLQADGALWRYDWLFDDAGRALELFPNEPFINLAYAEAARWQDQPETAQRYADRFLLLGEPASGQMLQAQVLLGDAAAALGDTAGVHAAFGAALRRLPDEPVLLARYALALLRLGLPEAAEPHLARARGLEPDNPWVLAANGTWLLLKSDFAGATQYLRAAYDQLPTAYLAETLADACAAQRDGDCARQYYQAALAQGGNPARLHAKRDRVSF